MKKKVIIIGIVVLIVGGIAYKLAANKKVIEANSKMANTNIIIPVNIITAGLSKPENNLVKTGTLIPFKDADITAVSAGKLTSVNFELGDYVTEGAILATVDNAGLRLSLEAAELSRNKAEKDFKRYKALLAGEATTEMNFQDAKLNFENAQNQIEQIQKQISDNRIKAPVSGQIVSKLKEAGEFVSPGTVLGHIVDVNRLKVDVMVGEHDVYSLKNGTPVKVTTDIYPGVTFDGKVIFISQSGDAVHNYQVEVALQNRKDHPLRAGSFAYVDFNRKSQEDLLLVPKSALIHSLDKPMVYVVENGKAKAVNITVGQTYGNDIAVISGLQPGQQVITSGLVNISDGTAVKPVKD
ncbi:MAG TPA: efflux RND transporter periplasmic adaptor subunit [Edaphocola sp.]|nr:efflux RND transporter periplasmic adaptor subunit [Edaphocola sp.]